VRRALLLPVMLVTTSAHADHWYKSKERVAHVAITVAGGVFYLTTETAFKTDLAPTLCRWCQPPSLDVHVRNALVWKTPGDADLLSSATGLMILPIAALAIDGIPALARGPAYAELIDDTLPILESEVTTSVLTNIVKFSVGRQRPYAHFAAGVPFSLEDNLSFFSGHASLAFSTAISAGIVAHERGYAAEPYIWAGGLTLAALTGYLRIAADKHYFSDVLVGAAVGTGAGLLVPQLTIHHLTFVPQQDGVAVAGQW
jgi:membrane-associated phospholipid phosphatase